MMKSPKTKSTPPRMFLITYMECFYFGTLAYDASQARYGRPHTDKPMNICVYIHTYIYIYIHMYMCMYMYMNYMNIHGCGLRLGTELDLPASRGSMHIGQALELLGNIEASEL